MSGTSEIPFSSVSQKGRRLGCWGHGLSHQNLWDLHVLVGFRQKLILMSIIFDLFWLLVMKEFFFRKKNRKAPKKGE